MKVAAPEDGMNTYGTVKMTPAGDITAGMIASWTFEYTAGAAGLKQGGTWRLLIPHGFSTPIIMNRPWPAADNEPNANDVEDYLPYDLGFVTVRAPEGCELDLSLMSPDESFSHSVSGQNGRFIFCTLVKGSLRRGDTLTLCYGDTVSGSAGASSPAISHTVEFSSAVDPEGRQKGPDGGFWILPSPRLKVLGGPIEHWEIIAASQTDEQGIINAVAVPRDKYENPSGEVQTELSVSGEEMEWKLNVPVKLHGWNRSLHLDKLEMGETGGRIHVEDTRYSLLARSNPILPFSKNTFNVYWGDLHCHTGPDFREELVEELFHHAVDIANLDFCAYTPHEDFPVKLTEEDWKTSQKVTGRHNLPGRFVSFIGYEYRNRGDYIVLYDREDQPFFKGMLPTTNTPEKLFRFLDTQINGRSMLLPHLHYLPVFQDSSSGLGVLELRDLIDERIRNVEIYSMHGSAEHPGCLRSQSGTIARGYSPRVSDILNHLRSTRLCLGFTGSTDSHTGHPGNSRWLRNRVQYPGGITAALANRLTREDIWEAIWNHRTYATTGARIILGFEINGEIMGSCLTMTEDKQPRRCHVEVVGTEPIVKATIVRNSEEVYTEPGRGEEISFDWEDNQILAGKTYYYLRVVQQDGHIGWSSPIWIV